MHAEKDADEAPCNVKVDVVKMFLNLDTVYQFASGMILQTYDGC